MTTPAVQAAEAKAQRCVCGHRRRSHVQNKNIPTGGCLAELTDGICICEQFSEAQ